MFTITPQQTVCFSLMLDDDLELVAQFDYCEEFGDKSIGEGDHEHIDNVSAFVFDHTTWETHECPLDHYELIEKIKDNRQNWSYESE